MACATNRGAIAQHSVGIRVVEDVPAAGTCPPISDFFEMGGPYIVPEFFRPTVPVLFRPTVPVLFRERGAAFISRDLLKKIPEFGEFESAFYPFRVLPAE